MSSLNSLNKELRVLKKKLHEVTLQLHSNPTVLGLEEVDLREKINKVRTQKAQYWAQRSKRNWIKLRDANTMYFHAKASHHRRKNFIQGVTDHRDKWITNPDDLLNHCWEFFSSQSKSIGSVLDSFLGLSTPTITNDQGLDLLKHVSMDEVHQIVKEMGNDKAPGPDSLNAFSFKKNIIKDQVFDYVQIFFLIGVLDAKLNETQIVLPNKENPQQATHFRPIGLCNVSYKILSKILVKRMKLLLNSLVSPFQNAVVPSRQISDNVMLLHTMGKKIKSKQVYLGLKLDIAKAYDRLEWNFLEMTLRKFNFPNHFVNLILTCVKT